MGNGLPLSVRVAMYRREVHMSKKSVERIDPLTVALPPEGVDSHAHLDGEEFDQDREAVLERARACGVAQVGNVFLGPQDFAARRQYFEAHPQVFFLLGIHPCHGQDCTPQALEAMRRAFAEDPRLKAVGEIFTGTTAPARCSTRPLPPSCIWRVKWGGLWSSIAARLKKKPLWFWSLRGLKTTPCCGTALARGRTWQRASLATAGIFLFPALLPIRPMKNCGRLWP